jgi:hypothetical protein
MAGEDMSLFANILKAGGKGRPVSVTTAGSADRHQLDAIQDVAGPGAATADAGPRRRRRTGRTKVYAVRMRESFKSEILGFQAEVQLERQKLNRRARKVTEGELLELMLETFKVSRSNGDVSGYAVLIPNVVWQGLHEIARRLQCSPTDAFEQLVVQKLDEFGLLARKSA